MDGCLFITFPYILLGILLFFTRPSPLHSYIPRVNSITQKHQDFMDTFHALGMNHITNGYCLITDVTMGSWYKITYKLSYGDLEFDRCCHLKGFNGKKAPEMVATFHVLCNLMSMCCGIYVHVLCKLHVHVLCNMISMYYDIKLHNAWTSSCTIHGHLVDIKLHNT